MEGRGDQPTGQLEDGWRMMNIMAQKEERWGRVRRGGMRGWGGQAMYTGRFFALR